jgi:hypothetical protein
MTSNWSDEPSPSVSLVSRHSSVKKQEKKSVLNAMRSSSSIIKFALIRKLKEKAVAEWAGV